MSLLELRNPTGPTFWLTTRLVPCRLLATELQSRPSFPKADPCRSHLDGSSPDADVIHTLNMLKEQWQGELNKTLHIKYTPRLHFHVDEAQRRGDRILQIMTEIEPPPAP